MNKRKGLFLLVVSSLYLLLGGCAENIRHIKDTYHVPVNMTFNASYKNVWTATVRALAENDIIKTMNEDAGVLVTDHGSVDGKELKMWDTVFFGRTFKYAYSINLRRAAAGRTTVKVIVHLRQDQFFNIIKRERRVSWVESYLREKIFKKICYNLFSDSRKCERMFEEQLNGVIQPVPAPRRTRQPYGQQPEYRQSLAQDIQQSLYNAGYDPGPVDGRIGRKTRNALKKFQQDRGIKVTGRGNHETLVALGLAQDSKNQSTPELVQEKKSLTTRDEHIKADDRIPENTVQSTVKRATTTETTELKESPDPFSKTLKSIPVGTSLELYEMTQGWYKIRFQELEGYIYSDFIKIMGSVK